MSEAEPLPTPKGVLHFPEGLPGFEALTQFVLLQDEELLPLAFLTSLSEPKVCLPVIPVQRICGDYQLKLAEADRKLLSLSGEPVVGTDVLCLAVLDLGDGRKAATANLVAPIVVNTETWTAKQVIQADCPYSSAAEVY